MLLYLQKEVLVFKSGLWYIMVFFLVIARIQNLLRLSCVLSLSNVRLKDKLALMYIQLDIFLTDETVQMCVIVIFH